MCDLDGQAALVTGAAQGIGFGIALEMARAGSRVVIADRDLPGANAAAQEIGKATRAEILAVGLDVADTEAVRACVDMSIRRFNRIDILVNNAGVHSERLGHLSTVNDFERCFDVNLFGVWRMTQALVP